jgi:MoxR-like ATPase
MHCIVHEHGLAGARLRADEQRPRADEQRPRAECKSLCAADDDTVSVAPSQARFQFIAYQVVADGPAVEEVGEGDDAVVAAQHWQLPAAEFEGLWESLVLPQVIKTRLLRYAATSVLFSDAGVDPTLVSLNRLLLLHGPPGTGKTTLCKALAQKLSLRMSRRYPNAVLLEVNSHSLFSRWFSESGKLVGKLFEHVHELVDDEESLVLVLVDEVESLSGARQAAMAGSEPSDTIRVVNALLTQLDALRSRPNVLILATSNITEAIDAAFVDRADLKLFIAPPNTAARYEILRSCLLELERARIIVPDAIPPAFSAAAAKLKLPIAAAPLAPTSTADAAQPASLAVAASAPVSSSSSSSSSATAAAAAASVLVSGAELPALPHHGHAAPPGSAHTARSGVSASSTAARPSAASALPSYGVLAQLIGQTSLAAAAADHSATQRPWAVSESKASDLSGPKGAGASATTTSLEHSDQAGVAEASAVLRVLADPAVQARIPAAAGLLLLAAAHSCGLSGRSLRKLPFTTHATQTDGGISGMAAYCAAVLRAVGDEAGARKAMSSA